MKTSQNAGSRGDCAAQKCPQKAHYHKPQLASFGTLASVTGSDMGGSFFDTMTSMVDGDMPPMEM